ncbi:MAG TPA: PAS domain S-box protein [Methanospirillum sp.]|nr:PAS domain S-box protein [Methanospirillum sp.]
MIAALYVDDESALLDICKAYLERSGTITVDIAHSAESALKKISSFAYDIVISDYEMPDMTGIDLLIHLRLQGNQIPFILFTGRGREEVAILALNNGADFYLQKGGDPKSQFVELIHKTHLAVDRRRTLAALKQSEQRLLDIINFLPEATFSIDISGKVVAWNKEIERITGVPAQDIIGKGGYAYSIPFFGSPQPMIIDLINRPDPFFDELYPEYQRENGNIIADIQFPYLPGGLRYYRCEAKLLCDPEGNPSGAIETIRDITEETISKISMKTSLEEYETINQYTPDWQYWEDPGGVIIHTSPSSYQITGYSAEEIKDNPRLITSIIHPDDQDIWKEHRHCAACSQSKEYIDIRIIHKNGEVRWINHICTSIFGIHDEYLGHWVCNRDISERKKIEEELLSAYKELATREEQLEQQNRQLIEDQLKIKAQEIQYRELFDHMPSGVAVYEVQGKEEPHFIFKDMNLAAQKIEQISKTDFIGRDVTEVFPGIEDLGLFQVFNRVYQSGDAEVLPAAQYQDDRIRGWRENRVYKLPSGDIVAVYDDISERINLQEEVTVNAQRYQQMAGLLPICVFETNKEGYFTFFNTQTLITFFYTQEDLDKGLHFTEVVIPDERQMAIANANRVLAGDCSHPGHEYHGIRKDGSIIPMMVYTSPIIRDGEVRGFRGAVIDMTSIQYEQKKFAHVFYNNPTIMGISLRSTGTFVDINHSFEQKFGYSRDEVIGKTTGDLGLFVDDHHRQEIIDRLTQKTPVNDLEVQVRTKEGKILTLLFSGDCMDVNSEGIIFTLGVDITERKMMEESLKLSNNKLNLLSSITRHDILNSLTTLIGALEILSDPTDQNEQNIALNRAEEAALLIKHQIEFTRDYQDLGCFDPVWFGASSLFTQVTDQFSGRFQCISSLEGLMIYADPLLPKLIFNLIDNSCRHGERVTRIQSEYQITTDGVVWAIEDDGVGIPDAKKGFLFLRKEGSEHGLGLFLSKEILALTGISIREAGRPGEGTRFEIIVPEGRYRIHREEGDEYCTTQRLG